MRAFDHLDGCGCGCCGGVETMTPQPLYNRPGLSSLSYRSGTYATFRQSMIADLAKSGHPSLAGLRSRAEDDFTIALIDAWAMTSDVLTFYIERTAQEQYLGTATERRSVDDLVQLIGYRLLSGVAAGSWLSFTLETVPNAQAGFRPTPVPGVPARVPIPEGVRVQSIPNPGELPQTFETIKEIEALADWNMLQPRLTAPVVPATGDEAGWFAGVGLDLGPGDVLLFVASDWVPGTPEARWNMRRVIGIDPVPVAKRTRVEWDQPLTGLDAVSGETVNVYRMRQRASLFGYNAPDPNIFTDQVRGRLDALLTDAKDEWKFDEIDQAANSSTIRLSTLVRGVQPGGWMVLTNPSGGATDLVLVTGVAEQSRSAYAVSAQVTTIKTDRADGDLNSRYDGLKLRGTAVLLESEPLTLADYPLDSTVGEEKIELGHPLDPIEAERTIVVRGRLAPASPAGGADLAPTTDALGDPPIGAEVAVVTDVQMVDNVATLILKEPLVNEYERASAEILGNIAPATHGETVRREVLGSGDGSKPYQQFTLRKQPLTYIRSDIPGGIASTLEIWVNDVRWSEARSLYGLGPRDRVYITTIADDGKTVITFGDGESGSRLPTGQDNVVATYRTGTGLEGEVDAGQLSLLLDRPLGVRAASNPIAPDGAAARQEADSARVNAPRTVLTLGRIVSLQDYEDFARNSAGIEKAAAVWTWDKRRRGVLITVAGAGGELVSEDSPEYISLLGEMTRSGSPRIPFVIKSYRPVTFMMSAKLRISPDRQEATVLQSVRDMLARRFSFTERSFGQAVTLSEVYAAFHTVAGVVSVDVEHLYRGESTALDTFLAAAAPRNGEPPGTEGAELLTLNPEALEKLEVIA